MLPIKNNIVLRLGHFLPLSKMPQKTSQQWVNFI